MTEERLNKRLDLEYKLNHWGDVEWSGQTQVRVMSGKTPQTGKKQTDRTNTARREGWDEVQVEGNHAGDDRRWRDWANQWDTRQVRRPLKITGGRTELWKNNKRLHKHLENTQTNWPRWQETSHATHWFCVFSTAVLVRAVSNTLSWMLTARLFNTGGREQEDVTLWLS